MAFVASYLYFDYFLQKEIIKYNGKIPIKEFSSVMFVLVLSFSVLTFIRILLCLMFGWNTSMNMSIMMAFNLIHASIIKFFDRVPIGNILSRFTQDLNQLDTPNSQQQSGFFTNICSILTDLSAATYASSPWMIVFALTYLLIIFKLQSSAMTLKYSASKLVSTTSVPLVQTFAETLQGASTIRAFSKQSITETKAATQLDDLGKNLILLEGLMRWQYMQLAFYSILIFVPAILLNIFVVKSGAGSFAILMKYLMSIIEDMNQTTKHYMNLQGYTVNFDRCKVFELVPPEPGYKDLSLLRKAVADKKSLSVVEKNPDWPSNGRLEIRDLKVSYNMSQVFILRGLTFTVPAGAKVGVVGRSGAGKTTLFSALSGNFDDYKGEIVLDSRELKSVDLKQWRAGITVVPQDPTLLSGTVRHNLDPFGVETDANIISKLTKLDLWQKFSQKGGLECHIEVGGSNLSQGEKQLMCMCRGLIEKNKLVLIDEATASIDESREQEVLTLMKEELAGCTVLTIAHRLNTVLNSDFILVMEDG